ncbi:hypothetical protein GE21DRAFT_6610 [Neurospora crassa]|uniref:RanBD1 domain-containing protein n=1 Tax=Neurospora crassa (strain ATCC 24698 / 74-OR23-1A / CBS 708.71 / DSM 1257 / FGSC 987) TaxID=367110 RepID=V5IPH6_NEUCR|nr:hypothetical protein NCU16888 [Neurospora crassa OR74A]ESA43064.1 hypothetical protein NCU16888 [Neurospora crassa OR74A]KHE84924.1 hypothetical protein GE21DRAFT_6610 [Neurospora crassa]|eukprot:XP_011394437.1 hypothetical protein NCU16888 [Neurospora crassa OR74A]
MADPTQNQQTDTADPVVAPVAKEDAETTAARRELKHTSISEQSAAAAQDSGSDNGTPTAGSRKATPEPAIGDDKDTEMKEQVSSPKKKRAHDELEESKDAIDAQSGDQPSTEEAKPTATQSRTDRSEPEKKRARDETSASDDGVKETTSSASVATTTTEIPSKPAEPAAEIKPTSEEKPQTSSAAFAQSGFAKLASSTTSPFGALGASAAPSLFGSTNSGSASPFGTLGASTTAAAPTPPKLSFGSSAAAPSPFAGFNSASSGSVFGGGFSSGFGGSALGGAKLTSFGGKPGETLMSSKPAKPFGAPESDAEESEEEGGNEKEDAGANEDKEGENDEARTAAEEEKKLKLRKVVVDDGEGEDATLLAVRAKIFVMEKGVGWKERGAGMLKVNVPKASVKRDHNGNWDATSFDASALVEDSGDGEAGSGGGRKSVRLVMRQDHTLRVILNTAIVPAMTFAVTKKLKAAYVLFTAFEGTEPRQVQVKLSEANATAFKDLMDLIQKELSDE